MKNWFSGLLGHWLQASAPDGNGHGGTAPEAGGGLRGAAAHVGAGLELVLEQRVAERIAELSAALQRSEMACRAKSDQLDRLLADLRTPVDEVVGYAQLIETHPDLPQEVADDASQLLDACSRIAALLARQSENPQHRGGAGGSATSAVQASPPSPDTDPPPPPPKAQARPRVLVAEDYLPNQNVLRQQLGVLGCDAEIAANGLLALNLWREGQFDLILTDLNMPVMDGLELTRQLRMEESALGGRRRIPVVAISAVEERALHTFHDAGGDDALAKPATLNALRAVLVRWLPQLAEVGGDGTAAPPALKGAHDAVGGDAVLDMAQLYGMLGEVSIGQATDLIDTFHTVAARGLDLLEAAPNDLIEVSREMHKQKSSAQTVGAQRYARLAHALEVRVRAQSCGAVGPALAELRRALAEVVTAAARPHGVGGPVALERPQSQPQPQFHCGSVLVVDDDPVVLLQMKVMLQTLGVQDVLTADNGLVALQVIAWRPQQIEIVVCDLKMPEMDGIELIRQFSKTAFVGNLILMSGSDHQVLKTVHELATLQGLRVLGHLQKPVTPGQMAGLLARRGEPQWTKPGGGADGGEVSKADRFKLSGSAIRAGIAAGEFTVWFQPKVASADLKPVGVEALARWQRADGSFVPPELFIRIAEEDGLIGELSRVLARQALKEGAKLFAGGFRLKIALNLSARWLTDLRLPEFMLQLVHEVRLTPRNIILEVSETGLMSDPASALDVLTRMRIKGFDLSIDDFGVGYSSFEQIGRIPFTELKLDRSFVMGGTGDPAARAILESSMDIARKLGMSTVAEGVETQEQLELVRSLGCGALQGFLVAEPMPAEELLDMLREGRL